MATSQPTLTRQRAETTASLSRIVAAARQMFARHGYQKTTIKAIAGECGLTDAAVLYHFKSKRALLSAVLVSPEVAPVRVPRERWDPEATADELVRVFCTWARHADILRVSIGQALDDAEGRHLFFEEAQRAHARQIAEVLGPHCGEETDVVVQTLTSLVSGVAIDLILRHGGELERAADDESFHERLRDMLLLALPPRC